MATPDYRNFGPLRILTGQTASGKAAVALQLARAINAEIISMDSMKVYRGLDIGAAKPSLEARRSVPFHMLDVIEPTESYSLAQYIRGSLGALREIRLRGKEALFVGGTPLYLRGLLYGIFEGPGADPSLREELTKRARAESPESLHSELRRLDPVTADRLHPNDLHRVIRALEVISLTGKPLSEHQRQYPAPAPAVEYRLVAVRRADADLRARINKRVDRMFAAGLLDEVRRLVERGPLSASARKAIGYLECVRHLNGEISLDEAMELTRLSTWRMARKQRGWMKSFPGLTWLDVAEDEPAERIAERARALLFPGSESRN